MELSIRSCGAHSFLDRKKTVFHFIMKYEYILLYKHFTPHPLLYVAFYQFSSLSLCFFHITLLILVQIKQSTQINALYSSMFLVTNT